MIFILQKRLQTIVWNKKRKRRSSYKKIKQRKIRITLILLGGAVSLLAFFIVTYLREIHEQQVENQGEEVGIIVDLLTINPYSRPGILREKTNGIVIHYVGNPNSSAKQNRDYFEGLKNTQETKASAHFIVGLDGEIVQCIPSKEVAYASNNRNWDTIAIEVCHPDETGKFNEKTYQSLVKLAAWMANKYHIQNKNIIRHYDVTGKLCPKYYVEHEDAWKQLKKDIDNARQ